jgi:riboflavin synthase
MFTGIIQALGRMEKISTSGVSATLDIRAERFWSDVQLGDSIAIDGVCLTAKRISGDKCHFDVSKETLDRSIIGRYKPKAKVNLEKALRPMDRLGGHIVQGHVDGVGHYVGKITAGNNIEMQFDIQEENSRYAVEKGSIAINGISLTIAKIKGNQITVALIPHTLEVTNLSELSQGSPVNIECDIIAKYAEKLFAPYKSEKINENFLKEKGFD